MHLPQIEREALMRGDTIGAHASVFRHDRQALGLRVSRPECITHSDD
jgi:hypothetical protein